MGLSALRAFDAAARLGSYAAAAGELGQTPSAISHQIANLERLVGGRLFERVGRRMQMTAAGEALQPHVARGFEAFQAGLRATRNDPRVRQIRVSSLALFNQLVLIPRLAEFSRRWPEYEVRVEATPRMVNLVGEDVDIGIRIGGGRRKGLQSAPLVRISGLPVCRPDMARRRNLVSPAALAHAPLVHDMAQPRAWEVWFDSRGVERTSAPGDLWFDSAPAILHAAESGLGVALAIDPLVRAWPGFGEVLAPPFADAAGPGGRYWLTCRDEVAGERKVRVFSNWLRTVCADLQSGRAASV